MGVYHKTGDGFLSSGTSQPMPAAKRPRSSSTVVTVRTPPKTKAKSKTKSPFYARNPRYTGFPDQLGITHKFCTTLSLSSASGIMANYIFSCNGLYDPNITGTGGQPLYFDQCAALYDHYTVKASRCKIMLAGNGSTAGPQVYACLALDDDTNTSYTSVADLISDDVASWGLTGGVANKPLYLKAKWNAKKTEGIVDAATDPNMSGTIAANPAEQSYYRLAIQEAGFSSTVTVNFLVEIEYDTVWRERKDVAIS